MREVSELFTQPCFTLRTGLPNAYAIAEERAAADRQAQVELEGRLVAETQARIAAEEKAAEEQARREVAEQYARDLEEQKHCLDCLRNLAADRRGW